MASEKDSFFILTPINFKEGKPNPEMKSSPTIDKYDPQIFCRTCANADSCLVPIFKEEGLDYSLNKKIEKYLPIKVSEKDDLPVHLCYHCASILIAWDSLIVGCVEAEKKLTLLKNTLDNKNNEEVVEEVEDLINENLDSDDEPLISKKSVKKKEEKRDILQEKNDLQTLKPLEEETEGRPRRKRRKNDKREQLDIGGSTQCEESVVVKDSVREGSETVHQCPICRKIHKDPGLLSQDLYSHLAHKLAEGSDIWKENVCKICKTTCESLEKLSSHVLRFHADVKENSGVPGKRRKRKETEEDAGGKLTCEVCGKTMSKKYALKRHLATHSGEKKFTCHHCGKQYAQESGLQRHVQVIHEGVRKYKCPICSEVFGTNAELKSHQDNHTDPRPFQCDQCGRTFISQKHLYHHRKYHHTANGMRQLCNLCNRYFSSPSVLKRHHKVIHLGLKEFQCHVCSAQLSTKHYLQEHLRLHSDERPEVCSFCGKTFQVTGNLRQHLKTHMGKTQICHVCGKGFTRRCHLLIHMGSHRGLEHPRCEHCDRVFLLKTDLEKHLKKEHQTKECKDPVGEEIDPQKVLVTV